MQSETRKNDRYRLALALCLGLLLAGCGGLSNALHPEPVNSVWQRDGAVKRSLFFATDREAAVGSFGLHWGAALR